MDIETHEGGGRPPRQVLLDELDPHAAKLRSCAYRPRPTSSVCAGTRAVHRESPRGRILSSDPPAGLPGVMLTSPRLILGSVTAVRT